MPASGPQLTLFSINGTSPRPLESPPPEEPVVRPALPTPYFQDGDVVLYHGNCWDILPALDPVDLILTDPPYGMSFRPHGSAALRFNHPGVTGSIGIIGDQAHDFDPSWIGIAADRLSADGALILFCSEHRWSDFKSTVVATGLNLKRTLIWEKPNGFSQGDLEADFGVSTEFILHAHRGRRFLAPPREGNVLRFDRINPVDMLHPTEKPVPLMRYLLRKFRATSVLDPFAGSGTTLVAARTLHIPSIGIEVDEAYCRTAVERLRQRALTLNDPT